MNQLLTALRFYASDGHLSSIADFMGIHISTASRVIYKVSRTLAGLYNQHIKMPPQNDMENQRTFFNIASFPKVLGCVDCTHIRIQSPGEKLQLLLIN